MLPTLNDGDVLAVVPYDGGLPDRGDIVVFRSPQVPEREFVKRVIGLPGERVEIDQSAGSVSINGRVLSEPYAQEPTGCISPTCLWMVPEADSPEAQEQCVSERCYFVLGDNRPNSSDSRQGWLVPSENILGYVEVN